MRAAMFICMVCSTINASASPMISPDISRVVLEFSGGTATLDCHEYGRCSVTVKTPGETVHIPESKLATLGVVLPYDFNIYSSPFEFKTAGFSFQVRIQCPDKVLDAICIGGLTYWKGEIVDSNTFMRQIRDSPIREDEN